MKYNHEDRAIVTAFAKTNLIFWQDVYDRNKMLLRVYSDEEYVKRFGEYDMRNSLCSIMEAKWQIDHYNERIQNYEEDLALT